MLMTEREEADKKRLRDAVLVDERGCWVWQRSLDVDGYGQCYFRCTVRKAHRASYVLWNGPIPPGLSVLHRCNVRRCINPGHLYVGTHLKNMDDIRRAGSLAGEKNPKAKLTHVAVRRIRRAYCDLIEQFSRELNVSRASIRFVMSYRTWKTGDKNEKALDGTGILSADD